MHCSTAGVKQDYGATGILYDLGSVYEGLLKLTDVRKPQGKLYRLETVLMIVVLAKLCGEDKPLGIAEWAKHRQEELVQLLWLGRPSMPSHHTVRRILAHTVYAEEVERLVGAYNQRGEQGEVYALDGKAVRGVRRKDEEGSEYLLSVYDVKQMKVMAQVEVGRKENEITKAPQALKLVELSQKVITGDALHTQRGLASQIVHAQGDYVLPVKENQPQLYKNIQALFAPEYPKPGFGKIQTAFLTAQKVNKGHGRIEIRTITTSEMLNAYVAWPSLAQVYRLERQFHWRRNGRCYRTSCEVEFGFTSLTRTKATPARLLHIRRAHWGIACPGGLGQGDWLALSARCYAERRCYSHDSRQHRQGHGFAQSSGFGTHSPGQISQCGPSQTLVRCASFRCLCPPHHPFFPFLRKPCQFSSGPLPNLRFEVK